MLIKEIKNKFTLNEIQEKALENKGKNIIIDAPTASGKTEAILLSIEEGSRVTWMLPTITACTFMYRRLCKDFKNLNVRVSTSVMSEERFVYENFTHINIITCDPLMIAYLQKHNAGQKDKRTTAEVLVLDEIDNYPEKCRTALKIYISNVELQQVILASATLDEELKNIKSDFKRISFSKISNKIRYKSEIKNSFEDIVKIVKDNYKKKKIGFICNSIKDMDNAMSEIRYEMKLTEDDMSIIYHHSNLPNEVKLENERRLFEKEYDILISNDLISMSIDVDLDLLIMDWSDRMNVNIQRMGRLNRRNKKIYDTNLYIMDKYYYPPFIDEDVATYLLNKLDIKNKRFITNNIIKEWGDNIVLNDFSKEELLEEIDYKIKNNIEILLRDIPSVLRYEEIRVIEKRTKGQKIEAVRNIVTVDKKVNNIPYDWYYPCSEEGGEKDLLYMPWMETIDHPSGIRSNKWKIDKYDKDSGIRHISPYTGDSFSYYREDEYEEYDEFEDDDEIDLEFIEEKDYTVTKLSDLGYSYYDIKTDHTTSYYVNFLIEDCDLFKDVANSYSDDFLKRTYKITNRILNDLLSFSKNIVSNYYKLTERFDHGFNITEYFFKKLYPEIVMSKVLDVARYMYINLGPESLGSNIAAIYGIKEYEYGWFRFKYEWLAIPSYIKKYFIENCEKEIIKEYGELVHGLISLNKLNDNEILISYKEKQFVLNSKEIVYKKFRNESYYDVPTNHHHMFFAEYNNEKLFEKDMEYYSEEFLNNTYETTRKILSDLLDYSKSIISNEIRYNDRRKKGVNIVKNFFLSRYYNVSVHKVLEVATYMYDNLGPESLGYNSLGPNVAILGNLDKSEKYLRFNYNWIAFPLQLKQFVKERMKDLEENSELFDYELVLLEKDENKNIIVKYKDKNIIVPKFYEKYTYFHIESKHDYRPAGFPHVYDLDLYVFSADKGKYDYEMFENTYLYVIEILEELDEYSMTIHNVKYDKSERTWIGQSLVHRFFKEKYPEINVAKLLDVAIYINRDDLNWLDDKDYLIRRFASYDEYSIKMSFNYSWIGTNPKLREYFNKNIRKTLLKEYIRINYNDIIIECSDKECKHPVRLKYCSEVFDLPELS